MAKEKNLTIGWGKPTIYVKDISTSGGTWTKLPDAVEDSVQLTPTKGDKVEATIEGGAPEAVKYKRSTYELAYGIRNAAERDMPIEHEDGVVQNEYAVVVVPENPKAPGCYIERSAVSVEDPFNAADGSNWIYTHSVLTPTSGKMVKWGIMTVTESSGSISISASGRDFTSATEL